MRRREFLALVGGAVTVWPRRGHAQRPPPPLIGILSSAPPKSFVRPLLAFVRSLDHDGYVEGSTMALEHRWVDGQYDRLPEHAAELVARKATVIFALGNVAAQAAKAATRTIPIVFAVGGNPVDTGLVVSLNRPGGNATGVNMFAAELAAKRLDLLNELLAPGAAMAVLLNPHRPDAAAQSRELQQAARSVGRSIKVYEARNESEIVAAFADLAKVQTKALLVGNDPYFFSRREQLVSLAARHAVPAIYEWREFATEGGLMSYGTSLTDACRLAGSYTARILRGDKPQDLPVVQPTKFELVLNVTTAKALGLSFPASLLARADEVIE